jgi:hypothetical protein
VCACVVKPHARPSVHVVIHSSTRRSGSHSVPSAPTSREHRPALSYSEIWETEIHHQAVKSLRYLAAASSKSRHEWESEDEEDEDTIAGNLPDKREEEKKKEDK